MKEPRLTEQCHAWLAGRLRAGGRCIDATCGNGHDTVFMARLGCEVLALDVQEEALDGTRELLEREELLGWPRLVRGGHERLREAVPPEWIGRVAAVVYNLGYLPGGDKSLVTRTETTVESLRQAVELLEPEGAVSVMVYRGHPGGVEEYEAVRGWAAGLSELRWKVEVAATGGDQGPVWLIVESLRAAEPEVLGLDCCPESGADDLT